MNPSLKEALEKAESAKAGDDEGISAVLTSNLITTGIDVDMSSAILPGPFSAGPPMDASGRVIRPAD
ncbi:hypothetical protein [Nonomuraea sp. NPDC003804]|uniref:hypothetical protein n=1 Tax=Nonomuraea sp. NPDC003804 TaxID=3154547 RepID=UPI0033BAADCE